MQPKSHDLNGGNIAVYKQEICSMDMITNRKVGVIIGNVPQVHYMYDL